MKILVKNGTVYTERKLVKADILVENGTITKLEPGIQCDDATVVYADKSIVSPGFTDLHVHLRQPGYKHKETITTGTTAAAAGGFTAVCAMANVNPVPDTLAHLQEQLDAIEENAKIKVMPYGAITVGLQGEELAKMEEINLYVAGFSDDGRGVQSEEKMQQAMEKIHSLGSMTVAHCEVEKLLSPNATCVQKDSRFAKEHGFEGVSSASEWGEVERNIRISEKTGCRLHICHTSTKESFELIRLAKKKGIPVTCEVTPHNLLLSCDAITSDDGRFKMNPPLRNLEDVEAAVLALQDGTADAIATDHAPHTEAEKEGGFAKAMNGVVGLETAFPIVYTYLVKTNAISLEQLLDALIIGPNRVLATKAPEIKIGETANLTVIDMETERVVDPDKFETMGRFTPFSGWKATGWPIMTICNGSIVWVKEK